MSKVHISIIDTNGDGKISMTELYEFIVKEIKNAEKIKNMSNEDKHMHCMSVIKAFIGDEMYEKHKVFISGTISFIVSVAKNPAILSGIKMGKKFFGPCC